jgi:hypothetical protein
MKNIFLFIFLIYFSVNSYSQLESPILIQPPTNSTMVSVTPLLKWDSVPGVVFYEIQISRLPDCSITINVALPLVTATQFQVPNGDLTPNTIFYWRIIAHGSGSETGTSDIFNFRTLGTSQQEIGHLSDYIDNLVSINILTASQGNILNNRLESASNQLNLNHHFSAIIQMLLFELRVFILEFSNIIDENTSQPLLNNANGIISLINNGNNIIPTLSSMKAHQFDLGQNYPNPFNPSTNIEYTVPEKSHVILKIYDLLGKEVTTLADKVQESGTYISVWNASSYSSGIYFYRLTAGNNVQTKKMILKK